MAYQIDRAVWRWGSWVQGRIEEQIEVPLTKGKKRQTELKQKYNAEQITNLIYGELPAPDGSGKTATLNDTGQHQSYWQNIDPFAVIDDE